jgi:hypothetical protein
VAWMVGMEDSASAGQKTQAPSNAVTIRGRKKRFITEAAYHGGLTTWCQEVSGGGG